MRKINTLLKPLFIISLITLISICFSQETMGQKEMKLIDFNSNLYAIENPNGGNIAFMVTRKGVVVVDAGATPNDGEKIVSIVRSVTRKPIKYVILTHHHGDHINGLSGFPKNVQIIAHADLEHNYNNLNKKSFNNYIEQVLPNHLNNLKIQLDSIQDKGSEEYQNLAKKYNTNVDYFEDIKRIKFRTPDITFTDIYKLSLGNERIIIEYPGPGHTANNIIVKFSLHNVIHTGDLVFSKTFPYTVEEHGADIYNWMKILDDLYKENIYTVIPGHGEVEMKIAIKEQSDYFKSLARKIKELKNEGLNLEQIIAKFDAKDYELIGNEDQLPSNITAIYNQMIDPNAKWWEF